MAAARPIAARGRLPRSLGVRDIGLMATRGAYGNIPMDIAQHSGLPAVYLRAGLTAALNSRNALAPISSG